MLARRWLPRRIAFTAVLILICLASARAADDGEPLAFCNVVTHASTYAGQTVRVTAILEVGYEGRVLYDPACNTQSTWVDVTYPFKRSRKLNRLLDKDRRALVIVEGVFHAEEPYDIDPRMP
jgi:hypothetical protein